MSEQYESFFRDCPAALRGAIHPTIASVASGGLHGRNQGIQPSRSRECNLRSCGVVGCQFNFVETGTRAQGNQKLKKHYIDGHLAELIEAQQICDEEKEKEILSALKGSGFVQCESCHGIFSCRGIKAHWNRVHGGQGPEGQQLFTEQSARSAARVATNPQASSARRASAAVETVLKGVSRSEQAELGLDSGFSGFVEHLTDFDTIAMQTITESPITQKSWSYIPLSCRLHAAKCLLYVACALMLADDANRIRAYKAWSLFPVMVMKLDKRRGGKNTRCHHYADRDLLQRLAQFTAGNFSALLNSRRWPPASPTPGLMSPTQACQPPQQQQHSNANAPEVSQSQLPANDFVPHPDSVYNRTKWLAARGELSKATKALNPAHLAPTDTATFDQLTHLFPERIEELPERTNIQPAIAVSQEDLDSFLSGMRRGAAAGLSGWHGDWIKYVAFEETIGEKVRMALRLLFNTWLAGDVPLSCKPLLQQARLHAFSKKTPGIRPIQAGATWRRMLARLPIRVSREKIRKHFANIQFGCGCPDGITKVVLAATAGSQRPDSSRPGHTKCVVSLDGINAFNSVSKAAAVQGGNNNRRSETYSC